VFASRGWMRFALLCNFLGAVLLFLSFQATSSNFKLITTSDGRSALCVNNRALLTSHPGGAFSLGSSTCPEWEHARPAAVVNVERPAFVTMGFILTLIGFILQFLAFPSSKSVAQMREELKAAKRLEKQARSRRSD